MQRVDSIINAGWVIPVEPTATCFENHSVVIDQNKIIDVMPSELAAQQYSAKETFDLPKHALIPGLINAHTHASMNLLRGIADDLALMDWLQNHIWPAEAKWVNEDFVYEGTQLAIAESLRNGVTCFNDMYFFPDQAAKAVDESGFRASIGLIVIDFPTVWAANADEYLDKALTIHEQLKSIDRITTTLAPHAPYTVSDEPLKKIATYADELNIPIHMHVHETKFEVDQSIEQKGVSPLIRLSELGIASSRLVAVHMTQLTEEEIQLCAENQINVVHCAESNMKLASGFCPVHTLQEASINVCIGTDGAASNNDLDMLGEMRSAALLAKAVSENPTAVPAHVALEMATINGAKALEIDNVTGSLVKGKAADIAAIDLSQLETQPLYNPISQIVYSATRSQVTHTWIDGKCLLKDRKLTTLDEQKLKENALKWNHKLRETDKK